MSLSASVVIPSYNHAAFIEQALASVLGPEHPQLEVVLVDDGSSDDTLQHLASWRREPRLRVFTQENQGAHAALNRGISASHGDVVFILNSDDAYHPERIGVFLERFAHDPELALLASWLDVVDGAGRSLGIKQAYRSMPPWPRRGGGRGLSDTGDHLLALLEANYVATTSNIAFRRELFDRMKLRFLPLRYAHDWDFFLAAARAGAFELIEEPLVRYRVHGDNTIKEGRDDELGRGQMRFEILWVIARHANATLEHASRFGGHEELTERHWSSLPPFVSEPLFEQLLFLRGREKSPPAAYDQLLVYDHPLRDAAIRALAVRPGD